jgi:hypothetical protein
VSWDARNGILVLSTPLFRLTSPTDVRPPAKFVRPGTLPEGVPTGLGPLFGTPLQPKLTDHRTFHDALSDPVLNGFTSRVAMQNAHATVLQAVIPADTITDLGCGDGLLLQQIGTRYPQAVLMGVENQVERAQYAHRRLGTSGRICHLPLRTFFDTEVPSGGALISVARVQEDPTLATFLRQYDWVVLYGYNGETVAQLRAVAHVARLHPVTEQFTNAAGTVAALRCEAL